jgi:hypothetical protein
LRRLTAFHLVQQQAGFPPELSLSDLPFFLLMRKSKPYAGRNGGQVVSPQKGLNYLAGGGDDELRENAQWNVEYRAVESVAL